MFRAASTCLCSVVCYLTLGVSAIQAEWVQDGVPVCTADSTQTEVRMTSDGSGGAIVVWWDYRNSNKSDLYAQRVGADGEVLWAPDGVPVCTQPGSQSRADIISDGEGGAIITWHDERSCTACWDIYAQRVDANGSLLWQADGVLICGAGAYQTNPRIVTDGQHGAIIAWEDERGYVAKNIYAQRVDANGNRLWTPDGIAVCTAPNTQDQLRMISDRVGGAYLTWQDARTGGSDYWDIYVQRVSGTGSLYWSGNGFSVCVAADDQQWPSIVNDEGSGAIILWSDSRSGTDYDIYAQRLLGNGTVDWPTNGVVICASAGSQYSPQLTTDGQGGAIAVWRDTRGADNDVYAQRVLESGSADWPLAGVMICTAAGNQLAPSVAFDNGGGAVIAWEDARSGTGEEDIYIQSIDADGSVLWDEDGKVVCGAEHGQRFPAMLSDGSGGGIVGWSDNRLGDNWNIYAQSTQYGSPGAIGGGVVFPWDQGGISAPNPFRTRARISFDLVRDCMLSVRIYDASGKLVRVLSDGPLNSGRHELVWNGRDEGGQVAGSGVYICQFRGPGLSAAHKLVRVR